MYKNKVCGEAYVYTWKTYEGGRGTPIQLFCDKNDTCMLLNHGHGARLCTKVCAND